MSGVGDIDGDGYDDVIVGTPDYEATDGVAFVYLGSGNSGVPVLSPVGTGLLMAALVLAALRAQAAPSRPRAA